MVPIKELNIEVNIGQFCDKLFKKDFIIEELSRKKYAAKTNIVITKTLMISETFSLIQKFF